MFIIARYTVISITYWARRDQYEHTYFKKSWWTRICGFFLGFLCWDLHFMSLSGGKRQWWYFMEITLLTPQHHSQKYIFNVYLYVCCDGLIWYNIFSKTYIRKDIYYIKSHLGTTFVTCNIYSLKWLKFQNCWSFVVFFFGALNVLYRLFVHVVYG